MTRIDRVRSYITQVLREMAAATDPDEREELAKEIARLEGGGARRVLADMADQALKEQP